MENLTNKKILSRILRPFGQKNISLLTFRTKRTEETACLQFLPYLSLEPTNLSLSLLARELFLDASLLTCEVAQIVELSATHLTNLVHLDRSDVG